MSDREFLRVFVVGCSRGGTTLTQRLIAERFNLLTLPETRFFVSLIGDTDERMFPNTHRQRSLLKRASSSVRIRMGLSTGMEWDNAGAIPAPHRRKWSAAKTVAQDFLTGMDELATEAGSNGWLEKTPMHVHYAPEVMRYAQDAWMIHVIRDSKDNIASIWDAAQKYDDPWKQVYDRLERAVDNWNAAIADSARMVGQDRQIFVPYEGLSRNPELVLERIAQRIGFDKVTAPGSQIAPLGLTSERDQTWKTGAVSGKVAPAASKWDKALTPEQQSVASKMIAPIPEILLDEMREFDPDQTKVQGRSF